MARLDLVIFGATGFTGTYAVREMAQLAEKYPRLTWGIAGRAQDKLDKVLREVSKRIGEDLSTVKTIIARVEDEASLKNMCAQANVLVNCCGPYRHFGEPVVKAAIDSKTHYVDVSGETQFMKLMHLKYDAAARGAGVYVVSACGWDSIPVDLGIVFLQEKFGGTLNSVETYMYVSTGVAPKHGSVVNYGTWESLVYAVSYYNELRLLRKQLYPTSLPRFQPKLRARFPLHIRDGMWCLPFLGPDASVVYRTQRHLYEAEHKRPVQVKTYIKCPSLITSLVVAFTAVFLYIMTKTSFTRNILLEYPNIFSFGYVTKEHPCKEIINNSTFELDLYGQGWDEGADLEAEPPKKKIAAKVAGVNPGYGTTAVALLQSAITILKEKEKMPFSGGVLTPGAAFKGTSIVQRLDENNVKFKLVKSGERETTKL